MPLNDSVITNSFPAFTGLFTERVRRNIQSKIFVTLSPTVSSRAHADLMDEVYKGTYNMVMLNSAAELYTKSDSKIRNSFCDYE
jgi:hypothetical protein